MQKKRSEKALLCIRAGKCFLKHSSSTSLPAQPWGKRILQGKLHTH